ncbi:MAG: DUF937 domain-containing protein [Bryobacteraceae bacterium]
MNLLDLITSAAGGGAVQQMSNQFGLSEDQTQSAISALLPMLAGAVNQNAQQEGGMEGLLGALSSGNHQRYLDDPSHLTSQEGIADGNGILGHLLGDRSVSRQVAAQASAETGIDSGILKQMLPMVASLMMGGLSRGASSQGLLGAAASAAMGGGGGGGLLGAVASAVLGGGAPAPQPQASGLLGMLGPLLGGGGGQAQQSGGGMEDILRLAAGFLRK